MPPGPSGSEEELTGWLRGAPLGRIAGIPISANWSVLVVAAGIVALLTVGTLPRLLPDSQWPSRLAAASVAAIAFLASLVAHELGHALVARQHGVGVRGISLWLLGGVARLDRQAPTPGAEFLIAIAGPAVNLVLGAVFGAAYVWMETGPDRTADVWTTIVLWLAGTNILLAASNLLPGAPLDGGRVLTSLLWTRHGEAERARLQSGRIGFVLGILLAVLGAVLWWRGDQLGAVSLLLVGAFVAGAARTEIAAAAARWRLDRGTAGVAMQPHPTGVRLGTTVADYVGSPGPRTRPVLDADHRPVGWMAEPLAAPIPVPDRSWTRVEEIMLADSDVSRGWTNESLGTILAREPAGIPALIVLHDPDSFAPVGTVDRRRINEILSAPCDFWGRPRPTSPAAT